MDYAREVWRVARLEELCEMDRQGLQPNDTVAQRLPFVGVENVRSGTGVLDFDTDSRVGSNKSTTFRFDERHVLYAKLRPYLNKVATPDFEGRCSTELVPLLPREGVDRDFLAYLLRREETVAFVMASVTGARMPRTDMKVLMSMLVPFPPFDEQRRIANILNRAARIERLRARAIDHLHTFASALFIKMFGDPVDNPMGWSVHPFTELVEDGTKRVRKIWKRNYEVSGQIPIVDQGIMEISGYANEVEGSFDGELPVIVFGDHTRRFKLIRSRFFLGADGTKLLIPKCKDVDPVFLHAQLKCLIIEEAGYSRHFKFLKRKNLMIPPLDKQFKFRIISDISEELITPIGAATQAASALTASLMDRLLDGDPAPGRASGPGPA